MEALEYHRNCALEAWYAPLARNHLDLSQSLCLHLWPPRYLVFPCISRLLLYCASWYLVPLRSSHFCVPLTSWCLVLPGISYFLASRPFRYQVISSTPHFMVSRASGYLVLLSTSHAGAPGDPGAVPPQVHPMPQRPASEPIGAIALPITTINLKTNGAWAPCGGASFQSKLC